MDLRESMGIWYLPCHIVAVALRIGWKHCELLSYDKALYLGIPHNLILGCRKVWMLNCWATGEIGENCRKKRSYRDSNPGVRSQLKCTFKSYILFAGPFPPCLSPRGIKPLSLQYWAVPYRGTPSFQRDMCLSILPTRGRSMKVVWIWARESAVPHFASLRLGQVSGWSTDIQSLSWNPSGLFTPWGCLCMRLRQSCAVCLNPHTLEGPQAVYQTSHELWRLKTMYVCKGTPDAWWKSHVSWKDLPLGEFWHDTTDSSGAAQYDSYVMRWVFTVNVQPFSYA